MNDFDTFRREAVAAVRVALQWFFLAVPMGLLCGFLGTLFHLAVEHATELRAAQPWLLFLLPVAGLLITALYKVTKCEGVGTNNVIRAVQSGEPVSILLVPAIFLGTVLTHLCGGSAGREGAALQMGGSIGWNLGTLLRLKDHDRRTATISGMAAFFSALFGTPMAAAFLAMEIASIGIMYYAALVPCIWASLTAYMLAKAFHAPFENLAISSDVTLNFGGSVRVILLAVLCAFVSILFCKTMHGIKALYARFFPNPFVRAFTGGVIIILLSLLLRTDDYLGPGMNIIERALHGETAAFAFLLKILFTALTIGAGFKGGEIVPSFFTGATFGCLFAILTGASAPLCAAIGMVSVFCGVTNCPITALLISFELFGFDHAYYYLIAIAVSYMLSGYYSLYHAQTIVYSKFENSYVNRHGE